MTIDELRSERNARLAACDFYFLTDFAPKLLAAERTTIEMYRQTLRDLPQRYEGVDVIDEVDWPEMPTISITL